MYNAPVSEMNTLNHMCVLDLKKAFRLLIRKIWVRNTSLEVLLNIATIS